MSPMLTEEEKGVIRALQGDVPLVEGPFREIGLRLGMAQERVMTVIAGLIERGVIRRVGAVVRHGRVGYGTNAMVLWAVPPERCRAVGERLAAFSAVSHCYLREPYLEGRYNIYTMIHHRGTEEDCAALIDEMAKEVGIEDRLVLFSEREYKKTSMEYL